MNNPFKSLHEAVVERISSPVLGMFIVSLIVINWKVILILLYNGDLSGVQLISEIQNHVTNTSIIVYPALSTLAYIIIYPWIIYGASFLIEVVNTKKINSIKSIKDKVLLTKNESDEIKKRIVEIEDEYIRNIDARDTRIKELQKIVDGLREQVNSMTSTIAENNQRITNLSNADPLSSEDYDLLKTIVDNDMRADVDDIHNKTKIQMSKLKFVLGELKGRGYIDSDGRNYYPTHAGRKIVMKNKNPT